MGSKTASLCGTAGTIMTLLWLKLIFILNTLSPSFEEFTGFAYDIKTEKLIYSEHHSRYYSEGTLTHGKVVYRDPEGSIIATKILNFGPSLIAPNFRLEDKRFNLIEGAEKVGNSWALLFGSDSTLSRKPVEHPDNQDLVLDAGFDHFVREKWDKLVQGQRVDFLFGSPSEQRVFKFQLILTQKSEHDEGTTLYLQMAPRSILLKWLVKPIKLCYSKSKSTSRIRLMEYRGISNINKTSDEKYRAVIRFP